MATMTQEQIKQKLQQLEQLTEEAEALTKELVEVGAIEIPEENLDDVAGGYPRPLTPYQLMKEPKPEPRFHK